MNDRNTWTKFEARNPKLETISNDKKTKVSKKPRSRRSLRLIFRISKFVSDFDIRVSNLGSNLRNGGPVSGECKHVNSAG